MNSIGKIFKLYTCGVNVQHELGEVPVKLYPDPAYLKRHEECWEQCGIVEVQVEVTRWVEAQKPFTYSGSKTGKSNARPQEVQKEGKT